MFDPGQARIETLMFKSESLVINTEVVENGGVEVIDVNRVLHDVVGEVVRFSVVDTRFESTSCNPGAEAATVVVATHIQNEGTPSAAKAAAPITRYAARFASTAVVPTGAAPTRPSTRLDNHTPNPWTALIPANVSANHPGRP